MLRILRIGRSHERHTAASCGHVEQFMRRYDELLVWSQRIAGDRRQAEDLLHDVFIQFTLCQPDLDKIANLDGYLRRALRNLYVTNTRRADCIRMESLSMLDFDSAEMGLSTVDSSAQVHARDELRVICQYACARKETSKAGSVLILRYFHGYFPREIAQVVRCTRHAVICCLGAARKEAQQILENPDELTALSLSLSVPENTSPINVRSRADSLCEFRQAIFASRRGECLSEDRIRQLYSSEDSEAISCEILAHIVSCADCLESVNRLLLLTPLSQRYPSDTIDSDDSANPPDDSSTGTGGSKSDHFAKMMRHRKSAFEHHPRELLILANGYRVGSQKTGSEQMDYELSISLAEPLSLVEILSDTGMRLLMLNVEPLVEGGAKQSARIRLSDGRTLRVDLDLTGHWPNLRIIYCDPTCADVREIDLTDPWHETAEPTPMDALESGLLSERIPGRKWWCPLMGEWSRWLAPVGAVVAVLAVIVAAYLLRDSRNVPSATSLLRQAATSESRQMHVRGMVTHRILTLEERASSTGELITRRKIESWYSPAHRTSATRMYEEDGRLIAGEWCKPDGTKVEYAKSRLRAASGDQDIPQRSLTKDAIWRLTPTAESFSQVATRPENILVEEQSDVYVLHYKDTSAPHLLQASLTLRRPDLHAIEETLTLNDDGHVRDYRFVENTYEQRRLTEVASGVFSVDPELTSGPPAPATVAARLSSTPSPELLIEALVRLDGANALFDQVDVKRTPDSKLVLQGTTPTEERRNEIVTKLGHLAKDPAVHIMIRTASEVRQQQFESPKGAIAINAVEVTTDKIPVDSDVRSYFRKRGAVGEQLEQEVRVYANRVLDHSAQVQHQAAVVRQLTEMFSPVEVQSMNSAAKVAWYTLIRKHVQAMRRDMAALRQELGAVFPQAEIGFSSAGSDQQAGLASAVSHAFAATSSMDEAICKSLVSSPTQTSTPPVKTTAFWRLLNSSDVSAQQIESILDLKLTK